MTLIDILHAVDLGGIGIIKSPLSLAQKFFRFPKSTDLAAVAIAIANPEAAIANATAVFRTVSLFQPAQRLAVKLITVEHS